MQGPKQRVETIRLCWDLRFSRARPGPQGTLTPRVNRDAREAVLRSNRKGSSPGMLEYLVNSHRDEA